MIGLVAATPSEVRRIDLDVQDAEIHNVLRLLADAGQVNVVVPDQVVGRVTLKLKNVAWTKALEVVLAAKGLGQVRQGNVIQIDTLANLRSADESRLAKEKRRLEAAELLTVMIPLSYANAEEMRPIVETMLTERGRVVVEKRNNLLIVTDVAHNVDRVRRSLGLDR